jgi:hypothetical protein
MFRALVGGFLLGPFVLFALLLLWSKAGLAVLIALGVLVAALAVAVIAGEATGRPKPPGAVPVVPVVPPQVAAGHDVTLTSTAAQVRATARENLASPNKWRRHFQGWRYRSPGAGKD